MGKKLNIKKGYSRVIIITVFIWQVIMAIVFKTFGVLHIQIEDLFQSGGFRTSLVPFVISLCWVVFSPAGGYLAYRFPRRMNIIIGALMTTGKTYVYVFYM